MNTLGEHTKFLSQVWRRQLRSYCHATGIGTFALSHPCTPTRAATSARLGISPPAANSPSKASIRGCASSMSHSDVPVSTCDVNSYPTFDCENQGTNMMSQTSPSNMGTLQPRGAERDALSLPYSSSPHILTYPTQAKHEGKKKNTNHQIQFSDQQQ